jgi:hypothetical protein
MTVELTADARQRLNKHLDAVEAVLLAAVRSREQRRAVIDDLETQILDMLAQRTPRPSTADVEAVLASLDPPSRYAEGSPSVVPPSVPAPLASGSAPRWSRTAAAAMICAVLSVLILGASLAGQWLNTRPAPSLMTTSYDHFRDALDRKTFRQVTVRQDPKGQFLLIGDHHIVAVFPTQYTFDADVMAGLTQSCKRAGAALDYEPRTAFRWVPLLIPLFAASVLGVAGTLLGWIALRQIRRSQGTLTGRPLALIATWSFPAVALVAGLFCA